MNGQNAQVGQNSGPGAHPRQGSRLGSLERLAWLPIPLLAATIIAARVAGLRQSYQAETLRLVLSFIFYTLVSLGTLFLIGRNFLASGSPGLLLLECGVVLWSLAGTVGDVVAPLDANTNVTIFNTVILLAGMCHLAGAILSRQPPRALRPTALWLGAGCALALGALGLVTWAALGHWLPVFFIPGQGGTLVRYWVLASAIAMFVASGVLLLTGQRVERAPFTTWYALALLLLAVGLFGILDGAGGSVRHQRPSRWSEPGHLFAKLPDHLLGHRRHAPCPGQDRPGRSRSQGRRRTRARGGGAAGERGTVPLAL